MSYIGKTPTAVPLTSSDITDGIISTDKLADTSVTNAKINADIISAETELATAPADTDEFLISDAGVLKRLDASLVGGGITVADQYRLTTNTTWTTSDSTLTAWERADTDGSGYVGSAMSVSSGIFTFPSTGTYLIQAQALVSIANDQRFNSLTIETTLDNSSYSSASAGSQFIQVTESNYTSGSIYTSFIFNVSDTTNRKVRLRIGASGTNGNCGGDTNSNSTAVHFIRLGDST